MKIYYVISKSYNPYENLALEKVLMNKYKKNSLILYLWQNDNTIVIGKNQYIWNECKVEQFINDNGLIARRLSGGGAVYHDLGNLNFSIIGKSELLNENPFYNIIISSIRTLGILAEYNGKNDLLVDGKKISGAASFIVSGVQCQHGTMLINTDIERMESYLTPDANKLKRNNVQSVSSRVMNLIDVLPQIKVNDVIDAIISNLNCEKIDYINWNNEIQAETKFFENKQWIYEGKKI